MGASGDLIIVWKTENTVSLADVWFGLTLPKRNYQYINELENLKQKCCDGLIDGTTLSRFYPKSLLGKNDPDLTTN